jgi:hypothetical protein
MSFSINIIRKYQIVFLITKLVSHTEITRLKPWFKNKSNIILIIWSIVRKNNRGVWLSLGSSSTISLETLIIRNQLFDVHKLNHGVYLIFKYLISAVIICRVLLRLG